MGLDNGFVIHGIRREAIPEFIKLPFSQDYDDGVDLCYWRKCWGLRGEINSVLHLPYDKYVANVSREDIPEILNIIQRYMNPTYWEENARSIWSWEAMFPNLIQEYINLTWLYAYWETNPGIYVEWYDSY